MQECARNVTDGESVGRGMKPQSDREREIWNAALDAAVAIICPTPHVEEERECRDVAARVEALKIN